jgi:hypothetical protein
VVTLYEGIKSEPDARERPWATGVFGYDKDGMPIILKIIQPHIRRGKPLVELLPGVLSPKDIQIFLDDEDITDNRDKKLEHLAKALASAFAGEGDASAVTDARDAYDIQKPSADRFLAFAKSEAEATVTDQSGLPDSIQSKIEAAEYSESIGDVWAAASVYEEVSGVLEAMGKKDLAQEMTRREKINRRVAAAMMRGDE